VLATNRLERDKAYDVYFSDKKPIRTMAQNRYLWGVVYKTLSDALGYEVEEIHELCKHKHALRTAFDLQARGIVEVPMSTRMMDTKQMTEYIDKIRRWAMDEFGLYIPQPNELTDENFIESKHWI
jgi:hypothetical protein